MYQRKKDIFNQPTVESARRVTLTKYEGYTTDQRWEMETSEEVAVLKQMILNQANVCDFGIGMGRVSRPLLEEMSGIRIKGVDASDKMLQYCREHVPKDLQDRLDLIRYDNIDSIENDSINFAFAIYVLQHIPADEFETAVLQLNRIIKPDGSLYLLNTHKFRAVPMGRTTWFNDKFPQWDVIDKHFEEVRDVSYESTYMKKILKTHQSKLFKPKK